MNEGHGIPTGFHLQQSFPNLFNPATDIEFQIPRPSRVTLRVFDVLGREAERLVDGYQPAGEETRDHPVGEPHP